MLITKPRQGVPKSLLQHGIRWAVSARHLYHCCEYVWEPFRRTRIALPFDGPKYAIFGISQTDYIDFARKYTSWRRPQSTDAPQREMLRCCSYSRLGRLIERERDRSEANVRLLTH